MRQVSKAGRGEACLLIYPKDERVEELVRWGSLNGRSRAFIPSGFPRGCAIPVAIAAGHSSRRLLEPTRLFNAVDSIKKVDRRSSPYPKPASSQETRAGASSTTSNGS